MEEQYSKLGRPREVNNNRSIDQRLINPRTLIVLITVEVMWESNLNF